MNKMYETVIRPFVYDWTKKMFGPKTSEIGQNVEAQNEKGCGDDYDNYYRFFSCRESSWKGETETIECLKKVMSKVSEYVYLGLCREFVFRALMANTALSKGFSFSCLAN